MSFDYGTKWESLDINDKNQIIKTIQKSLDKNIKFLVFYNKDSDKTSYIASLDFTSILSNFF